MLLSINESSFIDPHKNIVHLNLKQSVIYIGDRQN